MNRPPTPPGMVHVICGKLGAQFVPQVAPVGPTRTRPELPVLERLPEGRNGLYGADPDCDHYITYRGWDGVMCVRCGGWYCA